MKNLENIFQGLIHLIGKPAFENRTKVHVTIIGLGGVGSWAAETLVRSGVCKITLIDLDDICISNSNRQLHTTHKNIGKSKVLTMQERLTDINPYAEIRSVQEFLNAGNIEMLIDKNTFVLDAIDSLKTKCELLTYCKLNNIQIVTTGGAGGKTNPLNIIVKDLNETFNDPFLQRIRKKLRLHFDFPKKKKIKYGIPTIFSPEVVLNMPIEQCYLDDSKLNPKNINCNSGLGTTMSVVACFGIIAAHTLLSLVDKINEEDNLIV